MKAPQQQDAEARMALSQLARTNLIAYACTCDPLFDPVRFHGGLAGIIEDAVIHRKRTRLIINVPPRHGKSRMVAQDGTSYLLGRRPDSNIVVASYATSLAVKASKWVRRRIDSPEYQTLFPGTVISTDDSRADYWTTTAGGGFQAVGIGSGLTGFGADLLIIDDPHKDRAEAESQTIRDNVWDWFTSTAMTRLSPQGVCLVIHTRWHKDDLTGRLIDPRRSEELQDAGAGDEIFEVVNLPALSKGDGDAMGRPLGEALWPERWPAQKLRSTRAAIGRYDWNALYEGDPQDRDANNELLSKIQYIDAAEVPAALEQPRVWDLATTAKQQSDYSAGARGGYDKNTGLFYLCHMHRQKSRWLQTKQSIASYGDAERNRIRLEAIGAFEALADEVRLERRDKNVVSIFKPTVDKLTRALPWLAKIEAGKFVMVRGAWNQDFRDELVAFPNSTHDDQVDAVSGLYEMCSQKTALTYA